MQHPEMQKREWQSRLKKKSDAYWYRWMGLYTLSLGAIVSLVLAGRSASPVVLTVLLAGYFTVGIFITAWFARQRALDEMGSPPGDSGTREKFD